MEWAGIQSVGKGGLSVGSDWIVGEGGGVQWDCMGWRGEGG